MVERRRPQPARYFWISSVGSSLSSNQADRRFEIARVGEAVGADRAQLGQAERRAVILGDIAARCAVGQRHPEPHPARDQRDPTRGDLDPAQLGQQLEPAVLRHDQQFAVGIDEHPVGRSSDWRRRDASRRLRLGRVAGDAQVVSRRRIGRRRAARPAGPSAGGWAPAALNAPARTVAARRHSAERAVVGGRPQAIQPGAAVLVPRRGEGGARQLLGIEPERRSLRGVAALGQGAGDRLGGDMPTETGRVGGRRAGRHGVGSRPDKRGREAGDPRPSPSSKVS